MDENVTKYYFYILSFPEQIILVISLPWEYVFPEISKYYFEKQNKILNKMCFYYFLKCHNFP